MLLAGWFVTFGLSTPVDRAEQADFHVGYQCGSGVGERFNGVGAKPAEDLGQLFVGGSGGPLGVVLHLGDHLT